MLGYILLIYAVQAIDCSTALADAGFVGPTIAYNPTGIGVTVFPGSKDIFTRSLSTTDCPEILCSLMEAGCKDPFTS